MPWKIDGTFERVTNNTQEQTPDKLWVQDLEASIKIIATRHDYHDHDIAEGITRCLNLDGYNQMYANLNMGGYKITNVDDATVNTDVPLYGQVIGSLTFDTPTPGDLSIVNRYGDVVDTVNIPTGGGGGTGTVTSIAIGSGLTGSPNPITTAGGINLPLIAPGQTYSGGISTLTLDDYGRVTGVVTGAFANTNLSNNQASNPPLSVTINSSTGTGTVIEEASEARAGIMSASQVATLNGLAAGSGEPDQILTKDQNFTNAVKLALSQQSGTNEIIINEVNGLNAGVMSTTQLAELNTQTNNTLSINTLLNSTFNINYNGSDLQMPIPLPNASALVGMAGVMSGTDKWKLDNIDVAVPASAGAAGNKGSIAYEDGWLYICIATNTWQRVAIATW